MNSRLFLPLMFLIFLGCTNKDDHPNDMEQFALNYSKAWSSQIPDSMALFFATDAELIINNAPAIIGRDKIASKAKTYMDPFTHFDHRMDSLVIVANKVHFYWSCDVQKIAESGNVLTIQFSGNEIWTMNEEGLIQKSITTKKMQTASNEFKSLLLQEDTGTAGSKVSSNATFVAF